MPFTDGIYGYKFENNMGIMPASVNPKTGIIHINEHLWKKMPQYARFFVLLHEYFHVIAKTTSEMEADRLALQTYEQYGYKESEAIDTLQNLLTFDSYEHYSRLAQVKRLSLEDDGKIS